MRPDQLKPEDFRRYPPQARALATAHLALLRRLPLTFLPNLLTQIVAYDWKFPAERRQLELEVGALASLSPAALEEWFREFSSIHLSADLERFDWAGAPERFVEQLSDYLWTTHQMDAFRAAATGYSERLRGSNPPEPPILPRLLITVIGHGVTDAPGPLFSLLRPQGVYFTHVNSEGGVAQLLNAVEDRARAHPQQYAHWYIDGGEALQTDRSVTSVSYAALEPVRRNLLRKIDGEIHRPSMGPEKLRTILAQMNPSELGFPANTDPVLSRFQISIFTEGSGTQIFSTSFAQWTARECLRRAQPVTTLVRFAPRQRQRPMNELLSADRPHAQLDPLGSLVDGDMGAYYNWINLQRLPGAERTSTLVWF